MSHEDIVLMAHLLRRAGFGATRDELEQRVARGYEATVEELLHPEKAPPALDDEDLTRRYHVDQTTFINLPQSNQAYWVRRMINTNRPLEEKIALFWHGVFATGWVKIHSGRAVMRQVDMLRRCGLGSFRTLLVELSKDPSMIFWLDNIDNHRDAVNENYGRELLELFSMGVGNYTEDDVRQVSRAFTGWTVRNAPYHSIRAELNSVWPYGDIDRYFQYRSEDHDDGEKTFLGVTRAFNGEDIIDFICQQPATAKFVARHLYNFFVADEPQVPAWNTVPPRDPEAIETLMQVFIESDYEIRPVLRVLFDSDFFKSALFARVKSPTELVVGVGRLAGGYQFPRPDDINLGMNTEIMGQGLLDPPSVEGWHTGQEWINSSALVQRVNIAVEQFSDVDRPGIRSMIDRIQAEGEDLSPERLVDTCLELMGPLVVPESTRQDLIGQASAGWETGPGNGATGHLLDGTIVEVFKLIATVPEYQFA